MKILITCIVLIATTTLISCKKEIITLPDDFTASQGTYIGVVHIAYSEDIDGQAIVYRFNVDNAEWEEISWTWSKQWDDTGWSLPNNSLIPGKEYRYKMRLHSDDTGYSEYSDEVTGYAFKAEPAEISSINRQTEGGRFSISINWTNPNDLLEIKNLQKIYYDIYRTEDGNIGDFDIIKTMEETVLNTNDINYLWSYTDTDNQLESSKSYTYKIVTRYHYDFVDSNGDYRDYIEYTVDGDPADDDGSGSGNGGDDNPIMDYTTTNLGQLIAAASGDIIVDIKEKVVNGDVYLGVITGTHVFGGKPALFKYNGSGFENVWTCDELSSSKKIYYAVTSSGASYVAGHGDSLSIFQRDGSSWSLDIAPDNIDSFYGIEVFNDELYLFAKFDDLQQVMKYNGTSWDKIGENIASGSDYDANIESVDGNLYVYYTNSNTLHIKHLNGNNWVSDLEWTQEWLSTIELAKNGGDLYFSSSTASSSEYDGGIYKVTGTTSVENLIPEGAADTWFIQGAFTMSVDADGNLIAASIKGEKVSETEVILYPYLILYDGSQWNTVSGDFTDGVPPVVVSTIGNDIYYIYGDAASINDVNDPSAIKSKKLAK